MASTATRAGEPATGTAEPRRPAPTARGGTTCNVSAGLERSLTQVARAILRLEVPQGALEDGESIDRAGYWLLVRLSGPSPVRLSGLAETVDLDLSTVSRQMRDLVACGLVVKVPDPQDGRASLLSLSDRGRAVLEAVSEARRLALAEAVADWSDDERNGLAAGLLRLEAGLHHAREHPSRGPQAGDERT